MEFSKGVPMERVEPEERLYDVEKMLGRDASSVFPTELKPKGINVEELSAGAVKFVTEKQLEEIKASRGERVEDGTVAADKSLAEILADNKAKKEEEFQEVWKSMKVGKNRPLDEEDCEFYDELAKSKWQTDRHIKESEQDELLAFKLARETRVVEVKPKEVDPSLLAAPAPAVKRKAGLISSKVTKPKPKVAAVVVKKAKPAGPQPPPTAAVASKGGDSGSDSEGGGGGLLGLAGYGSGDDSD
mmetsp:Transcript_17627/g.38456  ORF Transcript_17627/g.38456 Transcript_17627/m.38456 type:complete len:244 (-) Transcript_17627:67-798(-)